MGQLQTGALLVHVGLPLLFALGDYQGCMRREEGLLYSLGQGARTFANTFVGFLLVLGALSLLRAISPGS